MFKSRCMLRFLSVMLVSFFLISCAKDRFNTVPQIDFISLTPNNWVSNDPNPNGPILKFRLRDAEGDFGFQDTSISYVYIRNVADTLNSPDSLSFPNITLADKANLDMEVSVNINNALPPPRIPRPYTDTLYFEVFVKDFAGNKSNVIRTTAPFYYVTP